MLLCQTDSGCFMRQPEIVFGRTLRTQKIHIILERRIIRNRESPCDSRANGTEVTIYAMKTLIPDAAAAHECAVTIMCSGFSADTPFVAQGFAIRTDRKAIV